MDKEESRVHRYALLLVGLAIALSLWLSARWMSYSLNYNESHNLIYASLHTPAELLKIEDMHPPGFYLLMHFWQQFTGQNDILLRLPALLFAVISIVLAYGLGRSLYSEKVAVAGTLLFAVSPMQIAASSSARPYSLLTFAFLVSLLCFIRILKENKNSCHVLNSAAAFTALFVHYYGGFLPAYQFVYLLAGIRQRRAEMKKWLLFQGAAAIIYLPFAYIAVTRQLKLVNPIGGADILSFAKFVHLLYAISPLAQRFYMTVTPYVALIMLVFTGLALLGMFPVKENLLTFTYLAVPIVLVAAVSNIARLEFYQSYHFVFLIPVFALLTARGLSKLGNIGLAVGGLILLLSVAVPADNLIPDWKECARYLKDNARQDDAIAIGPELTDALWYYWPEADIIPLQRVILGERLPPRIWLILVYEDIYYDANAKSSLIQRLEQLGFSKAQVKHDVKNIDLMLFSKESDGTHSRQETGRKSAKKSIMQESALATGVSSVYRKVELNRRWQVSPGWCPNHFIGSVFLRKDPENADGCPYDKVSATACCAETLPLFKVTAHRKNGLPFAGLPATMMGAAGSAWYE